MKTIARFVASAAAVALMLAICVSQGVAAEDPKGPEFQGETYYGGVGDQGQGSQGGVGFALDERGIFLAGVDKNLFGGQALLVKYSLPPGPSPVWAARWPNRSGSGYFNDEVFGGVACTEEGIYCAGRSWSQTTDSGGSKEHKGVLVKFPLTGPTGPEAGGALWVGRPHFFPYMGNESLLCVTATHEAGVPVLYAGGYAQSNGTNNTAVLGKWTTQGQLLWSKVLGSTGWYMWSQADAVIAFNGAIYVAGYTHYHGNNSTIRPHAGLWKVDPSGAVLWFRPSEQPIRQDARLSIGLAADDRFIYLATTREKGPYGGFDALIVKYDEQGAVVWSKEWGTARDDMGYGLTVVGDRLFMTGETTGWVGGATDAFLLEVNADTGEVVSAGYHGGAADDTALDVLPGDQDLYLAGDSRSVVGGGNSAGQADLMLLRYALNRPPPLLTVAIDIKPGSEENPINPAAKGTIPVAILSTAALNAPLEVDRATVTFGRTGNEKSLTAVKCAPEDVNGDGLLDLLCHADTLTAAFQRGDTQGLLKGKTKAGRLFVGADRVTIVPPKEQSKEKAPAPEPPAVKPPPKPAPRPVAPPAVTPPSAVRHSSAPKTEAEALQQLRKEGGVAY
ncbi:MAG: hypothetical protein HY600_02685 [Candidatus Omnitrophica bacterium]|nr:hypothetical protein [Candidatus Omnitrophota bacterium]